ncbi:MAG: hypothetical protein LBO09_00790 [Candidatus Peribacteria bacterium]|nr:hypothetical protein [Candidatus Peribacteria bacterium]
MVLFLTYRSTLKKNKKLLRGAGIAIVLAFLGLSVLKWDSTLVHITSKLGAIPQIIQQPLGYGLGSSGPAIHHNGTMLPENYYFEILLDTGTIGLILWAIVIFQLIGMQAMLRKQGLTTPESVQIQRGLLALLLIGFVLHVFEDSMVNYLFFTIYGILL